MNMDRFQSFHGDAAAWRSRRTARTLAGVALAVAVMVPSQVQPALAADPNADSGTPGIQLDPNGPRTPEELGYTQAYADAKNAQFTLALRTRMATFAATGGIAPESSTVVTPNANGTNQIGVVTEYHQKTQAWCLPATAQTILAWNFGTTAYVGSSVATSQQNIANAIGNYTDDYTTFGWINREFIRWNKVFRYVPANDKASLSAFETRITQETDRWKQPLYVRVNVTSHYYAWWQSKTAYHATINIGYYNYGANAMIGDPYTDPQHTNGCQPVAGYPGYSSTFDYGCIYYNFPSGNYWRAMTGVVSGELPEQY